MSYQVLARKWRPKTFQEVVGQEHVLQTLINALTQNRLHHAYLFTGTRGVGKTTLGRILAKCFNCETGVTATPCGVCNACKNIDSGKFIDLIEIDAASRTKVEDMRDLLQNVQYAPTAGRYKIYLIDEVHMLSGHSFNALLKTLEEPPPHVKFLLATTDKQKLPITILSRCLQFNLKNIAPEKIFIHLKNLLSAENVSFEEIALKRIAHAAAGSIRDALSILDQAIAYGAGLVKTDEVNVMLGVIEQDKILHLLKALAENNVKKMFGIIEELAALAADFVAVLDELLNLLHQIALLQIIPNCDTQNWEYADDLKKLAQFFTPEAVQLYYQIGLIGKRDILFTPNLRQGFEMVILRMVAFKIENNEKNPSNVATPPANAPARMPAYVAQPAPPPPPSAPLNKPAATKTNAPLSTIKAASLETRENLKTKPNIESEKSGNLDLAKILPHLKLTGPTLALIHHCVIGNYDAEKIELLLTPNQAPLLNGKHEERLAQAFSEYLAKPMRVTIRVGTNHEATPATLLAREAAAIKNEVVKVLAEDTNLQNLLQTFDAKIIDETIERVEE